MKFRRLELFFGLLCLLVGIGLVAFDMYQYHVLKEQQELLEETMALSDEEGLSETAEEIHEEKSPGKLLQKVILIRKAEPINEFLHHQGLSEVDRKSLIKAIKPYYKSDKLKSGQAFYVIHTPQEFIEKVIFYLAPDKRLNLIRQGDQTFIAEGPPAELSKDIEYVHGTIRDSLFNDGRAAGLSRVTINKLVQIYSYSIDFQRAIRKGDTFDVVVERIKDPETGYNVTNNILHATLYIAGGPKPIYRFVGPNGIADYFNDKGQGVKRALLRTPVKGAKVTSKFGNRMHPIQGFNKMHRGVDFGAAHGAPILSAGDGHIKRIGYLGGYGNYILVQHNADYSTAYAHLSRFAPGMQKGKFVKQGQVIGHVGATGRATGPHLHYEVHYRQNQINPQTMTMPAQQRLRGKRLERFLDHKKTIDDYVQGLKKKR